MPDEKANTNQINGSVPTKAAGRLLALDLGEKRTGVAVSDEMRLTVRPLSVLHQTNWKELLHTVSAIVQHFDAKELVIGLPLNLDGTEGAAAQKARKRARNFELSLKLPVHLQDERLSSRAAEETLRSAGQTENTIREVVDSYAATIILYDFLERPVPA